MTRRYPNRVREACTPSGDDVTFLTSRIEFHSLPEISEILQYFFRHERPISRVGNLLYRATLVIDDAVQDTTTGALDRLMGITAMLGDVTQADMIFAQHSENALLFTTYRLLRRYLVDTYDISVV